MYPFWKRTRRDSEERMCGNTLCDGEDRLIRESVQDVYVAGLRVVRLRRRGFVTCVEIGGLPLLRVERFPYKTCCRLGGLELFKLRRRGTPTGPSAGPLFLEEGRRRLFWNIGPLAFREETSGVARVTRSLLHALTEDTSGDYAVHPVYTTGYCSGYVHACSFTRNSDRPGEAPDMPVIFRKGDILLSPVPDTREVESHFQVLKALQQKGVRIIFLVHDLIPLRHPEFCPAGFRDDFVRWLPLVSQFDGVITVSAGVAEDYRAWRRENGWNGPFFVDWFHLGGDMDHAAAGETLPESACAVFSAMKRRPSFLTVSTVEKRKGYGQALAAMEILWAKGIDVNFVMVGRRGWGIDELAARLERHPENGRRLFWLRGIGDAYLGRLYDAASCVLFPSEAEGFGLAVAEGAKHGRPLILRDMPVFRETAGEHAAYFTGREPEDLAACLEAWLLRDAEGRTISPAGIRPLSWKESAAMLLSRLPRFQGV